MKQHFINITATLLELTDDFNAMEQKTTTGSKQVTASSKAMRTIARVQAPYKGQQHGF
jgi:methyl-accepting chemotaxis protein